MPPDMGRRKMKKRRTHPPSQPSDPPIHPALSPSGIAFTPSSSHSSPPPNAPPWQPSPTWATPLCPTAHPQGHTVPDVKYPPPPVLRNAAPFQPRNCVHDTPPTRSQKLPDVMGLAYDGIERMVTHPPGYHGLPAIVSGKEKDGLPFYRPLPLPPQRSIPPSRIVASGE